MKRLLFWSVLSLWACQPSAPSPSAPSHVPSDTTALSSPRPSPDPYWNNLAILLAGRKPQDTLYWRSALQDSAWKAYARGLDQLWQRRQKALYDSLRPWAARELEPYHTWKGTVFYPFSGADWPTIFYIYPYGERYIFFGLEQEGDPHILRKLTPLEIAQSLQGTYATLADLLRLSFFKTKDMQVQLAQGKVRGLLPVFLALFGRTGHEIYSVEHIILKETGEIDTLSATAKKPPQSAWDKVVTGLRFQVAHPEQPLQEVIYLSLNAANPGLESQVGSYAFLSRLRPCVTLIKSASYLLFGPEFSIMRRLILSQSVAILEEDSGIPYRYFDSTAWRVQLYGVYHQPIPLFRNKYQADLWQAYRTYPVRRLPFNIGYHTVPGQSNLLWATRRDPKATLPPLPEEPTVASSDSLKPVLSPRPLPPGIYIPPALPPSDTSSDPSKPALQDSLPPDSDSTAVPSADSE